MRFLKSIQPDAKKNDENGMLCFFSNDLVEIVGFHKENR